jgi:hypothetical protein
MSILLGISIGGLIYTWLAIRNRALHFGILSEGLARQLVSLGRADSHADGPVLVSWFVVLPIDAQSVSRLPTHMYEGESELIVLHPLLKTEGDDNTILVMDLATQVDGEGKAKNLRKSRIELENYAVLKLTRQKLGEKISASRVKYLAIELIAPGFDVHGEKKQRKLLQRSLSSPYTWGVAAKTSGNHEIALVFSAEDESGEEIAQIGRIVHKIRVASILRLTHRQARVLMGILGVITTALMILQALQELLKL